MLLSPVRRSLPVNVSAFPQQPDYTSLIEALKNHKPHGLYLSQWSGGYDDNKIDGYVDGSGNAILIVTLAKAENKNKKKKNDGDEYVLAFVYKKSADGTPGTFDRINDIGTTASPAKLVQDKKLKEQAGGTLTDYAAAIVNKKQPPAGKFEKFSQPLTILDTTEWLKLNPITINRQ